MKRIFATILTITILFSTLPLSVFATDEVEQVEVIEEIADVENGDEEYYLPDNYGFEVMQGNDIYYIETGELLHSSNNGRPKTVDSNVTWIIEEEGFIYYSKIDGYNTYIYKIGEEKEFLKIFCPIVSFDVCGDFVYYLYNKEVRRINIQTQEEISLETCRNTGFFVKDGVVVGFDAEKLIAKNDKDIDETELFNYSFSSEYTKSIYYKNLSNVTLTGNQATDIINIALSQEGYHEGNSTADYGGTSSGSNNYCEYNRNYWGWDAHGSDYAWCAVFVSWCARMAMIPTNIIKNSARAGLSSSNFNLAKTTVPEVGNIAFIGYIGGSSLHTGIVYKVTDSTVYTIEGNTGNNKVEKRTYNRSATSGWNILYYGKPNYTNNNNVSNPYAACENCTKSGTKTFEYYGDGYCSSCHKKYNFESTRTTSGITTGTYSRTSNTYKKLYLRSSPYDNNNLITSSAFSSVEILSLVKNADGGRWYYVNAGGKTGYIVAYKVDEDYTYNTSYGNSQITISPTAYPTGTIQAKSFNLGGTITSKYNISTIKGEVINASTGVSALSAYDYPQRSSYSIQGSKIDRSLRFQTLKDGTYYLKYTVWDVTGNNSSKGNPKSWTSGNFSVATATPSTSVTPSISVINTEYGRRAEITCSDTRALIHVWSSKTGEKTGYGSVIIDFTSSGSYDLEAWTTKSGYYSSSTVYKNISISRMSAPSIGSVKYNSNNGTVVLSGDGIIYYTLDGTTPTKNSKKYTEPISLTSSKTIKAISTKYGYVNSEVTSKRITLSKPSAPSISRYNTKNKIAQGKTASVSWQKVSNAKGYKNGSTYTYAYTATLYKDGNVIRTYDTDGTVATFKLSDVGEYIIKVKANNFLGSSSNSNSVTIESMAPVTVTIIDKIKREGNVTDDIVSQIQENIDSHDGEDSLQIEGNIISVQKIDYDSIPSLPTTPSKQGFDFAGYSSELYHNAISDITGYALYEVKSYDVSFWNYYADGSDNNGQLGDTQEIMYTFAATPPTVEVPTGYMLSGWSVDNATSQCQDYTYVTGNMKLYTSYTWENKDLPTVIEITDVARDEKCTSYKVDLKYTNNNLSDTQSRIIIALYSSDGRMVYTQTEDVDMDKFIIGESVTSSITLNYVNLISKVSAVMVSVKNDLTGGAVSEMVYTETIDFPDESGYWDAWSSWSTTEQTASDTRQVESKVQYSYSDKKTTTSTTSKYLSGWTYVDTDIRSTSTSGWTTTKPTEFSNDSQKRKITSTEYVPATYKTQYRYGRWTNGSKVHFCPQVGYSYYGGSWYKNYSSWQDSYASVNTGTRYYCSSTNHDHINPYYYNGNQANWYYYTVNGYKYYWQETQQVQTGGGYYRYKYTDTYYTHNFYKWSDYSSWKDSVYTQSSTRKVKTRTVYRYRDYKLNYPGYDPNRDSTLEEQTVKTYPIEGNLVGIDGDFEGKKATVMVYKKTNTDPTQEQLEYVEQITLGAGNSYSFVVNPKEELDYEKTGDFIVTLSVEGCERLVNIDVIKADVPVHEVTFYSGDSEQFGETQFVKHGDSIDVNAVGIPEKEGKWFVRWDKSVVNIDKNITVTAVWENVKVPVVFVDHENETADIQEFEFGTAIVMPEVTLVEGKEFVGWEAEHEANSESKTELVDEENTEVEETQDDELIATEAMVITAKWKPLAYTVKFFDFGENEISSQTVEYGEAAIPPEFVEKDGVRYSWDLSSHEWWNVKYDMSIYPYIPQETKVAAPTIDVSTEEVGGTFYAELETSEENAKIYYSLYDEITEDIALAFTEEKILAPLAASDSEDIVLLEENADMVDEEDSQNGYNVFDVIQEYTEPIQITEGMIVYAFTINANGEFSPISVFEYEYYEQNDDNSIDVDSDTPQILIQDITASAEESVSVPIIIKNNPGLNDLTLILGYDAENLTLEYVENGTVFDESEFNYEINDDGSCKLTWVSDSEITSDGELVILNFIVGENEGIYDLSLSVEEVSSPNEEENPFTVIEETADFVEDDILYGDINGDEEIDFSDAILLLRFDVGMTTLTDAQIKAADINDDGEADFSDAILILKFDAGMINTLKN